MCGFHYSFDLVAVVILSIPESELRNWMIQVYNEDMHDGDYVFFYINQQTPDQALFNTLTSEDFWKANDGNDDKARRGYRNLFMVS